MGSHRSCVRCLEPLAVDSTSELCLICRLEIDTSQSSPTFDSPVRSQASTRTGVPHDHQAQQSSEGSGESICLIEEPPPLPTSPPGYRLIRRLGHGGMGDVFLACEETTERVVAMKFLRNAAGSRALDRFSIEVRALGRLDHPNIVRVLATDFYRADPYFTMEYAGGGALSEQVKRGGPMPVREAARVVAAAARAIHAAHVADVLHRDLKPSNLLLMANGTPKVSDFGLAKLTDVDDDLTKTGPLGTPSFMSPEQVSKKHGSIGPKSDVYGLGATLYYLLTGRPPFHGDSSEDILSHVESDTPERPRALRPDLALDLEAIVVKCLEKHPESRYDSAEALAEDLERYLAGQVPLAPPLTRWRRLGRWIGRQRRRAATATAGVFAASALVAIGLAIAPTPESPADPLDEIGKQLAEKEKVILIGETGLPRWHRWVMGSPELVLLPDGTCSFEAIGQCMLELCADPMNDRYKIHAEIQFVQTNRRAGGVTNAGLYFGGAATPGTSGKVGHTRFAVMFDDTPRVTPKGTESQEENVRFRRDASLIGPDRTFAGMQVGLASTPFQTTPGQTGPFRTIEVEVSPELVRVWWADKPGEQPRLFADVAAERLNGTNGSVLLEWDRRSPGHGVLPPDWSPRTSIGIWNERAAIAVRNVTITPF